ncbi:hypothetical protein LRS06_16190 [Hymenobacter sp. J193]|uniref:hypothetical protein n=1 Tax=Hymenobacter sp. J193 TaxID=2898429 RepID=UPI002150FE55|nr:hypothetical protein [Hymenobacter sp. J193]MCR5889277.1 hypothetical protein [Hymenobacter sp. J193]
MKTLFTWLSLLAVFSFTCCGNRQTLIHEEGILILDSSRNHTSFDYFIPCNISDSISLGKNILNIKSYVARRVRTGLFHFNLISTSWESTADSFYITQRKNKWKYVSAVELTLAPDENNSLIVEKVTPIKLGGVITTDRFFDGSYRILHARQIILPMTD